MWFNSCHNTSHKHHNGSIGEMVATSSCVNMSHFNVTNRRHESDSYEPQITNGTTAFTTNNNNLSIIDNN
jgi:hypothetical protein